MRAALLPTLAIALAGCSLVEQPTRMLPQETRNWRTIATSNDRARLRDWRSTFVKALAAARRGAKSQGLLGYVSYPAFSCRITAENALQKFRKLSGSQRQVGIIFPGDPLRQVLLGTLALGDELGALQYGIDETRNVAGYVERIGPDRWRLIMPEPHFESQLDVIELVPSSGVQR